MKIDYDLNWGSHLPVIAKIMMVSFGDVLELGAGFYSTPFLYWLCKDQNRKFVSYENNFDWWKMVWNLEAGASPSTHNIVKIDKLTEAHYVANFDNADIDRNWGVVLIDHSPSKRRIIDIKKLANKVNFIIVHDTQRNYKFCDYNKIYPLFKYRYDYKKNDWDSKIPQTTVLSNKYCHFLIL